MCQDDSRDKQTTTGWEQQNKKVYAVQSSTLLLGCSRAPLCSVATVTPSKDLALYATLRTSISGASSCSAPKTECLRALVLEDAVHKIRRLFALEGTSCRHTTSAILCHLRPLSSIKVQEIFCPTASRIETLAPLTRKLRSPVPIISLTDRLLLLGCGLPYVQEIAVVAHEIAVVPIVQPLSEAIVTRPWAATVRVAQLRSNRVAIDTVRASPDMCVCCCCNVAECTVTD